MQDNRSWKEEAQNSQLRRASRFMMRLMGKSPRSSDKDSSGPESAPSEVRQAEVGRHPPGSNHSISRSKLHPPPTRKTSINNRSPDSHKLAAATSKTGEAAAGGSSVRPSNGSDQDCSSPESAGPKAHQALVCRESPGGKHSSGSSSQPPPPTQKTSIGNKSPDSPKLPATTRRLSVHPPNNSRTQQPRGVSVPKPPGSSRAAGPSAAAQPDPGNSVGTDAGVTGSPNTNRKSDTEELIGRSPGCSDKVSPESAPPNVCQAAIFRQPPGGNRGASGARQHPPPTQKPGDRPPDGHKQEATAGKTGEAKATHPSNNSRTQGQPPRGVSLPKPPGSSRAAGPPAAAQPDRGNTVGTDAGVTGSRKSDAERQQVADFPQAIEITDAREGVDESLQAAPRPVDHAAGVSEQKEDGAATDPQSGLGDDVKGEGTATVPETTNIGRKIIKLPLLLFAKSPGVAPGVAPGVVPGVAPGAEPADGAEAASAEAAGSPKETGVGAKIKQILPALPKLHPSGPAETDSCTVNSKIKDFFKYTFGRQEADKTPAVDTVNEWSLTEVRRADHQGAEQVKVRDYGSSKDIAEKRSVSTDIQRASREGAEQAKGRDYGKWRSSPNDQQRLTPGLPGPHSPPRELTKRRATIHTEDLQQKPKQQMPESVRFRPRDTNKRVAYVEDTQQRPDQSIAEPDKVLLRAKDVPRRRGSISYDEDQILNQQTPVTTINTEDMEMFLQLLGVDKIEDLATTVSDEPLTDTQTDAFREVFEQFAHHSHGYIDKESLVSTLDRVGISINAGQMEKVLETADYDEDGEVSFQDFLTVMTDSQRFSKCVKAVGTEALQSVELFDTVFYKSLTKMLETGILPPATTEEIVQYYHRKILRLIRRAVRPDGEDGGHVLTYYSKGAHLIGLQSKQLMKYIQPLETLKRATDSPYLMRPSLSTVRRGARPYLKPAMMVKMGRMKSVKTWKTVEIEDRIRQLSIKHPGMETMEMITPVKIKVNMSLKERDRLTYNQICQIQRKSKAGVRSYLAALTQLKRRDTWNSWGSLQCYCHLHRSKGFPQTFTTYSWSWSGCRNAMETGDLVSAGPAPPRPGPAPEPVHRRRRSQQPDRGGGHGGVATPLARDWPDGSAAAAGRRRSGPREQTEEDDLDVRAPALPSRLDALPPAAAPALPSRVDAPPPPAAVSERRGDANVDARHTGGDSPPSSLAACNPRRPDEYAEFDYDYDYEWNIAPYYVARKDRPPS